MPLTGQFIRMPINGHLNSSGYLILAIRLLFGYLWIGAFIFCGSAKAQNEMALPADCKDAKTLSVMKDYISPVAPEGPGNVAEFKREPKKSLYAFQDEHNTAWYTFKIPADGLLSFDILPEIITDDYDFILYKIPLGKEIAYPCRNILEKSLQPVRTCISRNDTSIKSWTGLKPEASEHFIHSGPGKSYVNEIKVEKGEVYYLVLDNVYPDGGRHRINFHYHSFFSLEGNIQSDSSDQPISARIAIENAKTGQLVAEATADPKTGIFHIEPDLDFREEYEMIVTAPGHFFLTQELDPKSLSKETLSPNPTFQNLILPALKISRRFTLEGMNFQPNVAILVPESIPKTVRLTQFMLDNPNVDILIEGHTNCAPWGERSLDQPLSEARAKKIFDILTDAGVSHTRLERRGYGCSHMVEPTATTLPFQKRNMRVEIQITGYR